VRTGDLIRQAGISRRALRLYEEKRLIRPSRSLDNGYRVYDRETVERIHTIRLLQTIGFSLAEVRQLIAGAEIDWAHTLELQAQLLERRRAELGDALHQVRRILRELRSGSTGGEIAVIKTIAAPKRPREEYRAMRETVSKYYNERAREKLANHPASPEEIQLGERAWAAIISEIEGMIRDGKDPASPQALALIKRMDALIGAFTLGDPDIEEGLHKLYADRKNWAADAPMAYSPEVWDYVGRMRAAASK
jgi:MerR family transcriptional regulator, thiopeptide resistance regulator